MFSIRFPLENGQVYAKLFKKATALGKVLLFYHQKAH